MLAINRPSWDNADRTYSKCAVLPSPCALALLALTPGPIFQTILSHHFTTIIGKSRTFLNCKLLSGTQLAATYACDLLCKIRSKNHFGACDGSPSGKAVFVRFWNFLDYCLGYLKVRLDIPLCRFYLANSKHI